MNSESTDDKEFEATPQKLDEARKKGDLVKSSEITVAASYAGLLLAIFAIGPATASAFGTALALLIGQADSLSSEYFGGGVATGGWIMARTLTPLALWFGFPFALVLVALIAQRALIFAPEKLQPKLSRIDPIKNAGQKFGRTGLFEFAKSFVKLLVVSILLGMFLHDRLDLILGTQHQSARQVASQLADLMTDFLGLLLAIAVVIGALDYLWQRSEFMRRNRMSRKELKDQMKQSEGDPHMKAQRRQKGIELATRQMLGDVAKADVVIVNPTHYAIALRWDRGSGRAPVCVAKGLDQLAARIREIAAEGGVPIHSDPPTARALYATINVGDEIQPDHYKPVAAAIRFAERMRKAARAVGRR